MTAPLELHWRHLLGRALTDALLATRDELAKAARVARGVNALTRCGHCAEDRHAVCVVRIVDGRPWSCSCFLHAPLSGDHLAALGRRRAQLADGRISEVPR